MFVLKFFATIFFVAAAHAATIGQFSHPLSFNRLIRGLDKSAKRSPQIAADVSVPPVGVNVPGIVNVNTPPIDVNAGIAL
jgi:hypothetical protein